MGGAANAGRKTPCTLMGTALDGWDPPPREAGQAMTHPALIPAPTLVASLVERPAFFPNALGRRGARLSSPPGGLSFLITRRSPASRNGDGAHPR